MRHAANIDKALKPTTQPVIVYRGAGNDHTLFGEASKKSLVGVKFRDGGFLSTSVDASVARVFAKQNHFVDTSLDAPVGSPVVFEVRMPKGVKAIRLGSKVEKEVLFERGLSFEVVEDRMSGDIRRLTIELVKSNEAKARR